jgi:nucleoside-diphosphate-sugar epimerase
VQLTSNDLMLVTGATGLVGSHVVEEALKRGVPVRVLVRSGSDTSLLDEWGVEKVTGDLGIPASLKKAVEGVTVIVHCAAKIGDWGPVEEYRKINVDGLNNLLDEVQHNGTLKAFIHISSLGVYEARDHHGTDETELPHVTGIDGYTLTKAESEQVVLKRIREKALPATVLRPGFIYGPRDRIVLPRLLKKLKAGKVKYLGSTDKLMNNTYVSNLTQAIFLAIEKDECRGEVFNIRDDRPASKREFMETISQLAGYTPPATKPFHLGIARGLASILEKTYRFLGKQHAPILSNARIKFLGLNLDFCIDKARRELGYDPKVDFKQAMYETIDWFQGQGMI